ncbi:MAG: glycogen/starch synthase, partial [Patescibacteria group bacterium]|nr:glycogen/starch synthase [Patescibacteria group bacterium]
MKKIKVLMVGYETAPFYKKGGLGDVMGSLPKALAELKVDCRVVIPYYGSIKEKFTSNALNLRDEKIGEFSICFGEKEEQIGIYKSILPESNVTIYFLSNKRNLSYLYARGRNKKIDQFAFFDLAVSHFVLWLRSKSKWTPSIVHCNDWHTALIPLILRKRFKLSTPTLLTIHNLLHQGCGSIKILDLLHFKDEEVKELKTGMPANEINILGEGIMHGDVISTVSQSYAEEISSDNCRWPIYGFLRRREKEMSKNGGVLGILNGIDYNVWNPKIDNLINHKYDLSSWKIGKNTNKDDFLREVGLENKPTFCFIGRIAPQKGLDLLVRVMKRLVDLDINIIILGSGNKNIEKSLQRQVEKYPKNVKLI